MKYLSLVLLLLASALHAGEPKSKDAIRFPVMPAPATPKADPALPINLPAGTLLVIESDIELMIDGIPSGVVSVRARKGPMSITARFVGGTGDYEDRDYVGPFINVVQATGTGATTLVIVPVGAKSKSEWRKVSILANVAPQPPPKPPEPEPKPQPDNPFPATGFRVLIVYESAKTLPVGQHSAIYGKKVRDYLQAKCAIGPDGKTKEFRIYDKDLDVSADADHWTKGLARPRSALPWIIISNGSTWHEGLLPGSIEETLALLKRFGGE